MKRIVLAMVKVCLLSALALAAACDSAEEVQVDDVDSTQDALTYYPDSQPDPLPTAADMVQPQGVVTIYPGARACYPALPASNSAGIGGQIAGYGISKLPRVLVFWARDYNSTVSKIYAGAIQPDRYGYFETVLQKTTPGYAGYFPGVFVFCIRNPSVNTGPIQTNAYVTTY